MWLIPLPLALGFVVGAGSVRFIVRGLRPSLRWWPVGTIGACLAVVTWLNVDIPAPTLFFAISLVAFALFAAANLHLAGASIVLLGVLLNLVPLLINQETPVRPEAIVGADIAEWEDIERVQFGTGRALQSTEHQLSILGAVLPIRPVGEVFSFGDLIIMAGLANVGFRLSRPRDAATRTPRQRLTREQVIDLTTLTRSTIEVDEQPATVPTIRTLEGSGVFGSTEDRR
jgi:hypothetical protein